MPRDAEYSLESPIYLIPCVAISQLPLPSQIAHVSQITENPPSSQEERAHELSAQRLHIGPTLPPISGKLIKRIEQGNFIEMAELLPESLGHIATDDNQPAVPNPKRRPVSDIVEWLVLDYGQLLHLRSGGP